jgi:hypothetical protein
MVLSSVLVELLSAWGSIASLVGLAISLRPAGKEISQGEVISFGGAGVLALFFTFVRLREYNRLKPRAFKSKKQIRDYMFNWISRGARVAIFSRDMSWVDDDEMRELLRKKARRHELILCLPKQIELSRELSSLGADAHVYPDLDYVPTARFTIINTGRHDSQVAIGRSIGGVHTIQEATSGHDPLFAVADDLVSIVSRLDRCR